ncbi:transglutaminase domain-containing protein [Chitinophaga rhizosphaerae]|uniref:transglutaminase domain-containing protein n=1 Tax=Chitinophaga rhizosphaerae TaxID=1864947 RepID=UPI000F814E28|nr:transglutaminase domain-containing protein [Chitinophaga rhizosphaerae]
MQLKTVVLTPLFLVWAMMLAAQDKTPVKYGKVSPEDFKTRYDIDTGAAAVVLADVGSSEFESGRDWFIQMYKQHRRIHILRKSAYEKANISIELYMQGAAEESLSNLKACSYNLENGKVVETKLESKAVFTEKVDRNIVRKKFTLPAVKEGTIIEYSFTINSEFPTYLRPWAFQDIEMPVLWSEYEVSLPEYYEYLFLSQGYNGYHIKSSKDSRKTFSFNMKGESLASPSRHVSVTPGITTHRWVMKDVPPLKEESFVTTLKNHISYIEFQLSSIRFPETPVRNIMGTWPRFMEEMGKDEDYAGELMRANNFLSDDVKRLTAGVSTAKEKAANIFGFVRDNYTCTDYSAIWKSQSLKTTFNKKNGNVTDINILLTALLREAGLDASPVLLSTRSHGKIYAMYPIRSKLNYTVVSVYAEGEEFFLDATRPFLGFGKLHASCYNGPARKVNASADPLSFEADSLSERSVTGVFISPDDNGRLSGHFQRQYSFFESYDARSRIREKGQDVFFKDLAKGFVADIEMSNGKLQELENYSNQLLVDYDFKLGEMDESGMVYFQPMFSESIRSNPFKSENRKYPIEMPAVTDYNYSLTLTLPENCSFEEIPKSTIVKFNDGEGIFQYLVQQNGNQLLMRSRLKFNRASYEAEEYQPLREFFDVVVKKHAEQIVIKKKKA